MPQVSLYYTVYSIALVRCFTIPTDLIHSSIQYILSRLSFQFIPSLYVIFLHAANVTRYFIIQHQGRPAISSPASYYDMKHGKLLPIALILASPAHDALSLLNDKSNFVTNFGFGRGAAIPLLETTINHPLIHHLMLMAIPRQER